MINQILHDFSKNYSEQVDPVINLLKGDDPL